MELDEIKSAWHDLNQKYDQQREVNVQLLREQKSDRAIAQLRPLVIGKFIQLIVGSAMCLGFGSYWWEHLGSMHLMMSGLSLHLFGILLVVLAIRELILICRFDVSQPVVTNQKRLVTLQTRRIQSEKIFAYVNCFIWIPFLIVFFQLIGLDVLAGNSSALYWVIANLLCGVGFVLAVMTWLRYAMPNLDPVGKKRIQQAKQELNAITDFESQ